MTDISTNQNDSQWPAVLEALKGKMTKGQFEGVFLGSDGFDDGTNYNVLLKPHIDLRMVNDRYFAIVWETLSVAMGTENVNLHFDHLPETQAVEVDEIEVPKQYSDAQSIVDAMDRINITGNVTPDNWYKWITFDSGKPHLAAVVILGDVVYFYRPQIIKDEQTGQVIERRKRFAGHKLQRSYAQFGLKFGISKKQARDAVSKLVSLGIVTTEVKDVLVLEDGRTLSNVMYIEVVPPMIERITFELPTV